ncbi:DNA primase [Nocardioides nematodiphilus]|uniref:DNA primase n=1 Tax=Nocardioides nematodiphilus TaxID=2849669 RepID=UPI001CD952B7|nr:DNA primase [Nocardioides nematodiphilus]MCA1983856.1 DNA primase [Nocardioides nematodiphilus]
MAGRILDKSIQEVRERARIDDVISQYVTLRNAGGGSMKGLCPFHDEKSPSFQVTPARQMFYCFGCQTGGDVISFVMKIDGLGFGETVERLAEKYGVPLEREEGDGQQDRPRGPQRGKLIEAHKIAQEFFAEQLMTPGAVKGRQFLAERSFDQAAALQFGIGFAPTDGRSLHQHLRGRGFSDEELVVGGLTRQNGWDVFQGRVLWPIRESSGDVIGFGARKLFDDDRINGKYINTSETPIYKKNTVLYGIDLAREGMRKTGQAVVVEGYTDVMACHLAGITTAVATCGTAFTPDHAKVVRRFMADHTQSSGEVIFTFDGDAAGQAAAMKVFNGDSEFTSQTYVAVAPDGLDPCDLRMQQGDEAVRELIAGRQPLYRFVLGNVLAKHDLDRADGRVDALREGARLVSSVRDKSKVDAFAHELAAMVGVEPDQARAEVRRAGARDNRVVASTAPAGQRRDAPVAVAEQAAPPRPPVPDLRDPRFAIERATLRVLIQHPVAVGRLTADITAADFQHPAYQAVWGLIAAAGGPGAGAGDKAWATKLAGAATTPQLTSLVSALAVEPLTSHREPDAGYVTEHVIRLREASLQRRISDVHSRLQRTSPAEDPAGYQALFGELATLEQQRRSLRERLIG